MKNKNENHPQDHIVEAYDYSELSAEMKEAKEHLVHEILRIRRSSRITQKYIEERCGVKQPVIARMERGQTDPQLTTVLKVLKPLGKTLAIVPLDEKK